MFTWPLDSFGIIVEALKGTGDNFPSVANDGSDEYTYASSAYNRAIAYAMESHNWGYATLTVVLTPSPTPPQDTDFDTAYPIPSDTVHILWVKVAAISSSSPPSLDTPRLTNWKIAGTPNGPVIVINAQGGPPPPNPPITPAQVTMYYVSNSGVLCDPTNGTPLLVEALIEYTMAGIYRSLHEDMAEGDKVWMAAEAMLQKARTRYDQQKPKRQFFNSRITAVRRIRRPWPAVGINNWGSGSGDGVPG